MAFKENGRTFCAHQIGSHPLPHGGGGGGIYPYPPSTLTPFPKPTHLPNFQSPFPVYPPAPSPTLPNTAPTTPTNAPTFIPHPHTHSLPIPTPTTSSKGRVFPPPTLPTPTTTHICSDPSACRPRHGPNLYPPPPSFHLLFPINTDPHHPHPHQRTCTHLSTYPPTPPPYPHRYHAQGERAAPPPPLSARGAAVRGAGTARRPRRGVAIPRANAPTVLRPLVLHPPEDAFIVHSPCTSLHFLGLCHLPQVSANLPGY